MSNQPAPQPTSALKNPQIILALISGAVTIVAAIIGVLPHLLPASPTPTLTITPIVVTATFLPTSTVDDTNTQILPTQIPSPAQPTLISLIQPTPDVALTANANRTPDVKLLYDNVSFNVLNQSGRPLSLAGVTFHSTSGKWDARDWGSSIYINVPAANCLRLRDASAGQRTPPAACANHIYGLIEVGISALFWTNTDHFEVIRNDQTIATCDTSAGECGIYIPSA